MLPTTARSAPRVAHVFGGNDPVGAFVSHMIAVQRNIEAHASRGLDRAARLIEEDARGRPGHYQPAVGPFPAWAPLSASYEAKKVAAGFPANSPLVRSGDMRDSIGRTVRGMEAVVGATDPTMVFHELGTSRMPPRPVLGPAVFRNRKAIERLLGDALRDGILGGQITEAGGYFG